MRFSRNTYIVVQAVGIYNLVIVYCEWCSIKEHPVRAGHNAMLYDQTVAGVNYLDCSQ